MIEIVSLICAKCNEEYDPHDGTETVARELGDGTLCLSCPMCGDDLAVIR